MKRGHKAVRYCGDIVLVIRVVRMRGDDGRVRDFYKATVSVHGPHYSDSGGVAISPREAGATGTPWSEEAYDKAALAMVKGLHARFKTGQYGEFEGGRFIIRRTALAECPTR